uniref:Putative secreted protein n=1 Tax=Ixodes ricinus TaxID=34613 RepID=V5GMG6_IXORI
MQLVVFAVVLILPSFLSGEFSATIDEVSNECEGIIVNGGILACEKQDSYYVRYDLKTCFVICNDGKGPQLPNEVCSNGEVQNCTPKMKQTLKNWESRYI